MKKKPLKIISLFAGAVGMDLGFKNAGFKLCGQTILIQTLKKYYEQYQKFLKV